MITKAKRQPDTAVTRSLLTAGAVSGPLFSVTFLVNGALRADYSPLRHPVSSLSLGDSGWIQVANFIVAGILMLALVVGLRRALRPSPGSFSGPLLVGLAALGLIGAGLFLTDPINGYPPGTPLMLTEYSAHERIHDLFGVLTFLGWPVACFFFCYGFMRTRKHLWAAYSALSGFAMLAFFVLAGMGFSQVPGFSDLAGLSQRLSITVGFVWLTLLAISVLRMTREAV